MLLLGCDPSMFVEVKAAPAPAAAGTAAADNAAAAAATGEASARQGGSEPPSKRARTEGAAAAPGSAQQQQGRQPGGSTAAAAAAGSPVMLVLVGAQGAGKSTFCKELQRKTERPGGHRRWARVNQDTIASGWGLFRAAVLVRVRVGGGVAAVQAGVCELQPGRCT